MRSSRTSRTATSTRPTPGASRAAEPAIVALNRREAVRAAGRRRAARIGVAVIVAAALGVGYQWWQDTRPPPTWVDAPRSDGPVVALGPPPLAYRVVSRVEAGNPVGTTVRTEILEVRRPWRSRLTTREGPPPGREITDVLVGDLGRLDLRPTGEVESALVLQADLAPSDLRLDVDLPALVEAGGVEVRERRTVLGEPCQVYRTTAPPQGQTIDELPSPTNDIVDSCVDRHGIILEQLQWFGDDLLLRRRAVEVDLDPDFDADAFDVREETTAPSGSGRGAVSEVDPADDQLGALFRIDRPPSGFHYDGRYAIAPTTPPRMDGQPELNRRSAVVDVWLDGPDVVFLEQGGLSFGGQALGEFPLSSEVDLGTLGDGEAVPGARLSQVVLRLPNARYVRLQGTLPVARLVALMKTVRRDDALARELETAAAGRGDEAIEDAPLLG